MLTTATGSILSVEMTGPSQPPGHLNKKRKRLHLPPRICIHEFMSNVHFLPGSKAGRTPLPTPTVAAIIGVEPHIVRQWNAKDLFGTDVKKRHVGRERLFNMGEGTLFAMLAAHLPITQSLKTSWAAVLGLAQTVVPIAHESWPYLPLDLFAVEAWDAQPGGDGSAKEVCLGEQEFVECIAGHRRAGRKHIHIIDLTRTFAEVVHGWNLAVLTPDEAWAEFESTYLLRLPPERQPFALLAYADLQKRIAAGRRTANPPPSNQSWGLRRAANVA
jgi:hypothetical protein